MDQRQKLKVHAKEAGNQIEGQKHGGQSRQRAHDVVGAVALRAEVDLHHGFCRLLQPARVVHHAINVLDNVACTGDQLVVLRLR